MTGEFPSQWASAAEHFYIWWRHHVTRGPPRWRVRSLQGGNFSPNPYLNTTCHLPWLNRIDSNAYLFALHVSVDQCIPHFIKWKVLKYYFYSTSNTSQRNSSDPAARCWQRGSSSFHRKNNRWSAFAILIANFNNDSSLPTFASTVPTCAGHFRIVPVSVFRVETKNNVFMTYPMHTWVPYWLFTMVYACVSHPCPFQLRIAPNLKSTRNYMGIDLVPYVKSHTSAQHNCKI